MAGGRAATIIGALRESHPGVIEEWERQRADGNEDWPDYQTHGGLWWWLDSEARLAEHWSRTDETGQERKLQEFCLHALSWLKGRDE